MKTAEKVASSIGKGLVAGFAGTEFEGLAVYGSRESRISIIIRVPGSTLTQAATRYTPPGANPRKRAPNA